MTAKWLDILNDDGARWVCQQAGRDFSMAQFRRRIHILQEAIENKECRDWILHDNDGFRFICAMFALLSTGRNVLIPSNSNQATIEALLKPGVGLLGFNPKFPNSMDIKAVLHDAEDAAPDKPITAQREWGQATFFTSGSSGAPKMIVKSAEQLYLEADSFNRKWRPAAGALFIPLVSHLHIYGLTFAYLLPLLARAGFYLPRNAGLLGVLEPITLASKCAMNELVVVTSPTIGRQSKQIHALAESESLSKDNRPLPITQVFCAGGKLTNANARRIIDLFDCPITEIFGSTESGAVATRQHCKHQHENQTNWWQLLPGLEAAVVGEATPESKFDTPFDANPEAKSGDLSVWGGHAGGSMDAPVITGDAVAFIDHERFELLGRSDQICKIEGKRASLPNLVAIVEGCELVGEAAVLPWAANGKEALLCGVVLSPAGESCYRASGKYATDLLIKTHISQFVDPVLRPRNIRYLERMPGNEMGKIPRQVLHELLAEPVFPELPLVGDVAGDHDALMLSLSIPMELRFLRGHFDNKPIVPGVVLLHWVYHFIDEHWKLPMNQAKINRLKFSHPVMPGDKLTLTLKRGATGVEFLYQNASARKFSSGQIPLKTETVDV